MVNHSTENSKSNQKQTRINKETQQWIQTESEVGSSCGSYKLSDDVKAELSRMNTNVENLLGCFYRLMHDRGKELDCSFNGGFDELGEIRIREHGGVIENQEFQSEFGFQFQEDSSMESGEASHHPYMVDLIRNGDSEASRQQTNHGSEILEAKIQAMWNLVNRTQTGDEGMRNSHPFATSDIMLEKIHRDIEKPNVQLSDCETNSLENYNDHTVFEEDRAEVETGEILIEAEVILGDVKLANRIDCGVANKDETDVIARGCSNYVTWGGILIEDQPIGGILVDHSIVARKRNGEVAGEMVMLQMKINGDVAGTELDHSELDVEAKNLDWKYVNIEHIKVKRINGDFEDPFYDSSNPVQTHPKFELLLAMRIAISMVEGKGWLAFECEECMLVLRSQDMFTAAGIGAQWLRLGVG